MLDSLRSRVHAVLMVFPAFLSRFGIVDRDVGEDAWDLAIPVMLTDGLRTLVLTIDIFMISIAIGSAGVAAITFGYQFHMLAMGLGLALSGGTISVVSRFYGAEDHSRVSLAIKQALWLTVLITIPMIVASWIWAEPLVALLTDDPAVIGRGADYLVVVMLSTPFHVWTLVSSRALAGAGDTRTPMFIRTSSLPTNTVVNAILIFGLGPFPALGVVGAGIGTTVANFIQAVLFMWVLLSGRFAVRMHVGGRQLDASLVREIVRVGLPLTGQRMAISFARFPFLFVLGVLGTNVVAAYTIARRMMSLARMPGRGYATAASTLVGQAIGGGDYDRAEYRGWQTLRIAIATQLVFVAGMVLGAEQLAVLFDAEDVGLTVQFLYVFGVMAVGSSIAASLQGGLRGAGDTTFPFYGTMLGNYAARLPVAFLALPTATVITVFGISVSPGLDLGVAAIFVSIIANTYTRALVNGWRYWSGRWKAVSAAAMQRSQTGAD